MLIQAMLMTSWSAEAWTEGREHLPWLFDEERLGLTIPLLLRRADEVIW
jgi:hypothetical protein